MIRRGAALFTTGLVLVILSSVGIVGHAGADDPTTTTVDTTTTQVPTTTTEVPPAPEPAEDPMVRLGRFIDLIRSLMPAPPANSGSGRRIVYSISRQRVWLVEANDQLNTTYLVSGRADQPRPGTFAVWSKSPTASSGSVSMRYMVRFARGRTLAIGFHSIPVRRNGTPLQTLGELGQFRSHGCVRQRLDDAKYLWDWTPIGTVVVVTP